MIESAENPEKKIGFLIGSLTGAGAEKTILTLASILAEEKLKVYLFVLTDKGDYVAPPTINLISLKERIDKRHINNNLLLSQGIDRLDLLVTSRPEYYDAITASNKYCSVHITPTAWLKQRPWLLTWKTALQIRKLKKKYQNKQIICLSNGIKADLVDNLGCHPNDISVIPNPFDFTLIRTKADEVLEPLPFQGRYIVYVAALIPRKRHLDLLKAFAALADQQINLLLLGKGKLEKELKQWVASHGLQTRIHFIGWSANPYKFIKNAEISVLTSEAEGMPRVLVESAVIGTPVISSNCYSGPEEVLTGENAKYLFAVGDVGSLTQKLNHMLAHPSAQTIDIARFDSHRIKQSYLALLPRDN